MIIDWDEMEVYDRRRAIGLISLMKDIMGGHGFLFFIFLSTFTLASWVSLLNVWHRFLAD